MKDKKKLPKLNSQEILGVGSDNLDTQRTSRPSEVNTGPTKTQINDVIDRYQKGLYDRAEELVKSIIQLHPHDLFSWKFLGILYLQLDKMSEALSANYKASQLAPQDAIVHLNLGVSQKSLGMRREAEESFNKVIKLKAD